MKNIRRFLGFLIIIIGIFMIFNSKTDVDAAGTFYSSLTATSTSARPSENITIKFTISGLPATGIGGAKYTIDYAEKLVEYSSISGISFYEVKNTGSALNLTYVDLALNNPLTNTSFNVVFKAKNEGVANFSLTSKGTSDATNAEIITSINSGTSVTIKAPSKVNNLEKIFLQSGEELKIFNPGVYQYKFTTNDDKISFGAIYAEGALIAGGGWSCNSTTRYCTITRNNLNYGNNQILFILKNELNESKTYTLNVFRNDTS